MGPRRRRTAPWIIVAALLIASTAACSDDTDGGGSDAAASPATSAPNAPESTDSTATSSPEATTDGVLKIGTLLPDTGPGNQIGLVGTNAVNIGVRQINESGGVLGQPVQWVPVSEGTSMDEARAGIDKLLTSNVDAIIGPASSLVALEVLDELLAAGVVVCSPAATALALNDYPDRDRFFRTVPSDSLSAQAMAAIALNTGVDSYAVVYLDDQFGRPFAQQTIARLAAGSDVDELTERPFPSDATPEEMAALAIELAEIAPRTIVLIADSEHGWPMLQAMANVFAADPADPPYVIINDAMRTPPSTEVVVDLPAEFRESIQGISPVVPSGPGEPTGPYATNALDCLNLLALAAVKAESDDPEAIADEMIDASVAGTLCSSFAVCLQIAEEDRNFNYQGPNLLDFSARGDPARGRIGTFRFDATGLDVPDAPATISELPD